MAEPTPASPDPHGEQDGAAQPERRPPARRRRGRWVAGIAGALLLLLILLVLFAPMIAATGPVRSLVLRQINQDLDGRVAIGDWSLGWTTGITARDIEVYDDRDQLVMRIDSLRTGLPLLRVIRGNFNFEEAVINRLELVRLEVDEEGETNLQRVAREDPRPRDPREPIEVPDLRGTVRINEILGTILLAGTNEAVHLDSGSMLLRIRDINQPIDNEINLIIRLGDRPPGSLTLAGNFGLIENNQVQEIQRLLAEQVLELAGVNVGAVTPVFRMAGLDIEAGGIAAGTVQFTAAGLNDLSAEGELEVIDGLFTGGMIAGDVFTSGRLYLPLAMSRSVDEAGRAHVRVRTARLELDQGVIDLTADAPEDALLAAVETIPLAIRHAILGEQIEQQAVEPTGGTGRAELTADLDMAALANQLPGTLALIEGTQLQSGRMSHATVVSLEPGRAVIETRTDLTEVTGTRDGRPIRLEPVHITANVTTISDPAPDLRDVNVVLSSDFLNVRGGGASLASQQWRGDFDLERFQNQLEQFVRVDELLARPAEVDPQEVPTSAAPSPDPDTRLAGRGEFEFTLDRAGPAQVARGNPQPPEGEGFWAGEEMSVRGNMIVTGFRIQQRGADVFHEERIELSNDVALNPDQQVLRIADLRLNMAGSGAIDLTVSGTLSDWERQRRFQDMQVDLGYDLAELWALIRPLLPPETQQDLAELVVSGQSRRTFEIAGSYPAEMRFNEAIRHLIVRGNLDVEYFQHEGLEIQNLPMGLVLEDGILTIPPGPSAVLNEGELRLAGTIDLTEDTPRLTTPANHMLVRGASLNPVFADTFFGRFVNPVFINPREARGLLEVNIVQCERLPLGALITGEHDGRAEIVFSISEVFLGNEVIRDLFQTIGLRGVDALEGQIREARIVIADGMVSHDLTLALQDFPLGFQGNVRMADKRLMPLNVQVPLAAIPGIDRRVRGLPETIPLQITDTTEAPRLDVSAWRDQVTRMMVQTGQRELLDRVLPAPRDRGREPAEPPDPDEPAEPDDQPPSEETRPSDPVGDVLDILRQRIDRDRERRERRREE